MCHKKPYDVTTGISQYIILTGDKNLKKKERRQFVYNSDKITLQRTSEYKICNLLLGNSCNRLKTEFGIIQNKVFDFTRRRESFSKFFCLVLRHRYRY